MTLKTRIAEVRALDEKRTRGDWIQVFSDEIYVNDAPEGAPPESGTPVLINNTPQDKNGWYPGKIAAADLSFIVRAPTMLTIINELTDKLDIARKFIDEVAHDLAIDIKRREQADKALKLTDIGE